ncbi:MAG: DUF3592 domain-containing protein [Actinomycetota bacterium]|nr:DUF3592 domain-containing protein [Actinomycetota bacterium]
MTAAVALAVVLVIAVAGLSLAMQTQRPVGPTQARPRPQPPIPRRPRERRAQPAASTPPTPPPPKPAEPESKGPELLRTGTKADAKVVSVVDERTVGPVTRSRLVLAITTEGGEAFEVTTRTAFPSPGARSAVRVGGTVPVRYDPRDHGRVVLDLPKDGPAKKASGSGEGPNTD